MTRDKRKRTVIIVSAILVVLLASIGTVAFIQSQQSNPDESSIQTETSNSADQPNTSKTEEQEVVMQPEKNPSKEVTADNTTVDPSTVASVDIAPMSLAVAYIKGVGGFEYQVLRTPSGTQYVEFSSPELVGTKCTDDAGAFASVLAEPQSDESATLAKTTTVNGVKYGLSLASDSCTGSPERLKEYQDSFTDAFGLLKKLD